MLKKFLITRIKILLVTPLILFCLCLMLSWVLAPKVIFVNQSGKDLKIFSYCVDSEYDFLKKYGDISIFIEEGVFKNEKYQKPLKKDKKLYYRLRLAGGGSVFWANWISSDKKINHEMELSEEDFVELKEMVITIDQKGNYEKEKTVIPFSQIDLLGIFILFSILIYILLIILTFFGFISIFIVNILKRNVIKNKRVDNHSE